MRRKVKAALKRQEYNQKSKQIQSANILSNVFFCLLVRTARQAGGGIFTILIEKRFPGKGKYSSGSADYFSIVFKLDS